MLLSVTEFDVEHGIANSPCHRFKLLLGPHPFQNWSERTESGSLPKCDGAKACSVYGTQRS